DGHLQEPRSMTMHDQEMPIPSAPERTPWNKGKLTGAKPPLRPKQVWSIRTKLQVEGRTRDLAMFNLAIDSKLRGCDVVSLKIEDVAPHGHGISDLIAEPEGPSFISRTVAHRACAPAMLVTQCHNPTFARSPRRLGRAA